MAAKLAQKKRITAFNIALLAQLSDQQPEDIRPERKLGLPPPATALGISRQRFMLSRKRLNKELQDPFYAPSTPVEKAEYSKLYADGRTVYDFHLMTDEHINVSA